MRRPDVVPVEPLRTQIASIKGLIGDRRTEMTQASDAGASLPVRNAEIPKAEQEYAFQTLQAQGALAAVGTAQVGATRQVRALDRRRARAPRRANPPRAFGNAALASRSSRAFPSWRRSPPRSRASRSRPDPLASPARAGYARAVQGEARP